MKKAIYIRILLGAWCLCLAACTVREPVAQQELEMQPVIQPDYTDVTIPPNIAPLRFRICSEADEAIAVLSCGTRQITEKAKDGKFLFGIREWRKLLEAARGQRIEVKVYERKKEVWAVYRSFFIQVAAEEADAFLAYRLIPPGYELWYEMGIYQRELSSYDETPIVLNHRTGHNCMNCHSFCMQDPDRMMLHMREAYAGTYIYKEGKLEKLNGKVSDKIPSLVYPSWHSSGDFIAFSTNQTTQLFHTTDRNRIEVYDMSSDVLVYDVRRHEVVTDSLLFSPQAFETFPTFAPDGRTLYFCAAQAKQMPEEYRQVQYSLCSISFDPETRTFGNVVDTLYHAGTTGSSAVFPRVSPDGRFLAFCAMDYGNFPVWHKEADLWLLDLKTGEARALEEANSNESDSYHSWSSNGRWLAFGSRRGDGLYTRPYLTYITPDGKAGKPFVISQADPEHYDGCMYSYNIPEFVKGKVKVSSHEIVNKAKEDEETGIVLAKSPIFEP